MKSQRKLENTLGIMETILYNLWDPANTVVWENLQCEMLILEYKKIYNQCSELSPWEIRERST